MTVRIVTDSTCDLPAALLAAHSIHAVPAHVNVGERSYTDGVDLTREAFYARLPDFPTHPQTAAAAPGVFTELYEALSADGATQIVSIHIAATLSGFINAAQAGAAAASGAPVTVVDAGQVSLGLGLMVLAAAEMAANGATPAAIADHMADLRRRTFVFAAIDTLEFLRRGGRVNFTQAGLGSLLRLKPILRIHDGAVETHARIRTWKRVPEALERIVTEQGPLERLAIVHTNAPDRAAALTAQFEPFFPDSTRLTALVTPGIGAHAGPGAVGFACIRRP